MTSRELIRIARDVLTAGELNVWITKHVAGKGRRSGSVALGITEDAWRYRLARADAKVLDALEQRQAA